MLRTLYSSYHRNVSDTSLNKKENFNLREFANKNQILHIEIN